MIYNFINVHAQSIAIVQGPTIDMQARWQAWVESKVGKEPPTVPPHVSHEYIAARERKWNWFQKKEALKLEDFLFELLADRQFELFEEIRLVQTV